MRRKLKRIGICLLLVCAVWCASVVKDRQSLHQELIRLHIIANSDSDEDQQLKLRVRDAVLESLREDMKSITDPQKAGQYLSENLPKLKAAAEKVLHQAGADQSVAVCLGEEEYPVREYDTFRLPSGVYQSLRIVLGSGSGHNWWCVVFPELCAPATVAGFEETAQCADFSDTLTAALEGREGYSIRFFLLDLLGKAETFLRRS